MRVQLIKVPNQALPHASFMLPIVTHMYTTVTCVSVCGMCWLFAAAACNYMWQVNIDLVKRPLHSRATLLKIINIALCDCKSICIYVCACVCVIDCVYVCASLCAPAIITYVCKYMCIGTATKQRLHRLRLHPCCKSLEHRPRLCSLAVSNCQFDLQDAFLK